MAREENINLFKKGERVIFPFFGRERDGSVMDSPGSRTIRMQVFSAAGTELVNVTSAGAQITLIDAATAEFLVSLSTTDLSSVTESEVGSYKIWSEGGASDPALQNFGEFRL